MIGLVLRNMASLGVAIHYVSWIGNRSLCSIIYGDTQPDHGVVIRYDIEKYYNTPQ